MPLKKYFSIVIYIFYVGFVIPVSAQNTASQADVLKSGLKKMIYQLKTGNRDSAFTWFKNHYYDLHHEQLLNDSLLIQLSDEVPSIGDKDSTVHPLTRSLKTLIRKEIYRIASELGEQDKTHIPAAFVQEIEKYIIQYRDDPKYHLFFNQALHRSRKYIPALKDYFVQKGFPEDVLYFALIESGYNPNAISSAGAAGMFQFMPATAKEYGLNVNSGQDERFLVMKSAQAAADYLKDLYLDLGNLNLALASYNSGPSKTRRALRGLNDVTDRSFWAIHQKSELLKSETRNYVPQIYAALIMAQPKNSARFGFDAVAFPIDSIYRTVRLPSSKTIEHLLLTTALSLKDVLKLNPDIRSLEQITHIDAQDYPLFVPWKLADEIRAQISIKTKENPKLTVVRKKPEKKKLRPTYSYDQGAVTESKIFNEGDSIHYMVQRGNTLHMVARLFKVHEKDVIKWNHLRFKSLRKGQRLLIKLPRTLKRITYKIPRQISYRELGKQFLQPAIDLRQLNRFKSSWLAEGDTVFVYLPWPRP